MGRGCLRRERADRDDVDPVFAHVSVAGPHDDSETGGLAAPASVHARGKLAEVCGGGFDLCCSELDLEGRPRILSVDDGVDLEPALVPVVEDLVRRGVARRPADRGRRETRRATRGS